MIHDLTKWFHAFVDRHLDESDSVEMQSHLELKRKHSLLVAHNAKAIAGQELESPRLRPLAHMAGLLHDVGRFPQYKVHRTFKDSDSVNHGHLGSKVLRGEGVLAGLDPAGRRAVLGAVHMHNRRFLPKYLPSDVRTLTRVTRDADKLDILRVMLAHFDRPGEDEVVVLHVEEHPVKYTPAVLQCALQGNSPDYRAMRYVNDFKILLLNWAFELYYPASRRIMLESGHVDRVLAHLPDDDGIRGLGRLVKAHLAQAG